MSYNKPNYHKIPFSSVLLLAAAADAFSRPNLPFTKSAFIPTGIATATPPTTTSLTAAPNRLEENVEGVVYVNEKCINCAACNNFAPSVFGRADRARAHIVYHQPETKEEILDARAAMAACPVAAIRSETLAQRRHRMSSENDKQVAEDSWTNQDEYLVQQMALSPKVNGLELPFPRPLLYHAATTPSKSLKTHLSNLYNIGYHNEMSFGATPYLLEATVQGKLAWIMVDTPKFGKSAKDAVTRLTGPKGPDYLLLTHVDDTAGHEKWAEEFPSLKRIFHLGDGGRFNWLGDTSLETDVEILLPPPKRESPLLPTQDESSAPFHAYAMDGTPLPNDWHQTFPDDPDNDVVILHTPGHSPGSITLYKKPSAEEPGVIFTGDHYAFSTKSSRMSGFPRYGNNLQVQANSLKGLLRLDWDVVAPGHGHPRNYSLESDKEALKRKEMQEAIEDLSN